MSTPHGLAGTWAWLCRSRPSVSLHRIGCVCLRSQLQPPPSPSPPALWISATGCCRSQSSLLLVRRLCQFIRCLCFIYYSLGLLVGCLPFPRHSSLCVACPFALTSSLVTPPPFRTFFSKSDSQKHGSDVLIRFHLSFNVPSFFSLLSNDASFLSIPQPDTLCMGVIALWFRSVRSFGYPSLTSFLSPGNKTLDILQSGIYPHGPRDMRNVCKRTPSILFVFSFLIFTPCKGTFITIYYQSNAHNVE